MELLKIVILIKKIKNAQYIKQVQASLNKDTKKTEAEILKYRQLILDYSENLTDLEQKTKIQNYLKAV